MYGLMLSAHVRVPKKRSREQKQANTESGDSADTFAAHGTLRIVDARTPTSKKAKIEGTWVGATPHALLELPGVQRDDGELVSTPELEDALQAIFCGVIFVLNPIESIVLPYCLIHLSFAALREFVVLVYQGDMQEACKCTLRTAYVRSLCFYFILWFESVAACRDDTA